MKYFKLLIALMLLLCFNNNATSIGINTATFPDEEEIMEEMIEEEEMMEEEIIEEEVVEEEIMENDPQKEKMKAFEEDLIEIKEEIPEVEKYYREKYEATYDAAFEDVWKALKTALAEENCMIMMEKFSQNEDGYFTGVLRSDFCLKAEGSDSTYSIIKRYSKKAPFIRGAIWVTLRMQYKFSIKEQDDGIVYLRLVGELSGREDHVTEQVHFWESNGYLEVMMLEKLNMLINQQGG